MSLAVSKAPRAMFVYKTREGQCGAARAGHTEAHCQAGLKVKAPVCHSFGVGFQPDCRPADLQGYVIGSRESCRLHPSNPSLGEELGGALEGRVLYPPRPPDKPQDRVRTRS